MSPEDREAIASSVANVWTFHTIFMSELMRALRDAGALSPKQIESLLQELDGQTEALEGPSDQQFAQSALATVRTLLSDDQKLP